MKYDFLTLDTQAFNNNGFDLDTGFLGQLGQFKDGATKVVISEVVVGELVRQLADKARQAKDKFEAAAKEAVRYGLDAEAALKMTVMDGKPRTLAEKRVKAFMDRIGAVEIPANMTDLERVLAAYFRPAPPFTGGGKKKNEFPDAIALQSLESWAEALDKRILAVSGDGDWQSFADKSSYIDVVVTIEEALATLAAHAEEAHGLVKAKLAEINDPDTDPAKTFRDLLANELENYTVYPDFSSSQPAEIDSTEMTLIRFVVAGEAPEFDFSVIQVGSDTIAASVDLTVSAKVSAEVSFEVWDSVDRESIPMGSITAERECDDLSATAIVTWAYDSFDGVWELMSVELVSIDDPDLDYVEMDFGGDWEDED